MLAIGIVTADVEVVVKYKTIISLAVSAVNVVVLSAVDVLVKGYVIDDVEVNT